LQFDAMTYHLDDTIAAIASAAGGAARGIVRVSGPQAVQVVAKCFDASDGRCLNKVYEATAIAGRATVALDSAPRQLPCELFLWPTDRSYTRQPVAEFHTLGSSPLLRALLATLCDAGARTSEPGEFTLRAFLTGRIDLTQAEAVLGVIDAQQPDQLQTALGQLAGGLARPLQTLRDELIHLLAEIEAGLDFVEEDIDFISAAELAARLHAILAGLHEILAKLGSRAVDSAAYKVVLIGPPNAGKSSLFNAMTKQFAAKNSTAQPSTPSAIVSPRQGTTRDYLVATIDVCGAACELVDTAGLESTSIAIGTDGGTADCDSQITSAAQSLSGEVRQQASIRALCIDATTATGVAALDIACDLLVLTKADRATSPAALAAWKSPRPTVVTSSLTGQGLDELREAIRKLLLSATHPDRGIAVAATADRCRDSLSTAEISLAHAVELTTSQMGSELVAAELRTALAELGRIVGAVYTDDILDRIFSTFCIGK
jgi:tRNA modification GTPase